MCGKYRHWYIAVAIISVAVLFLTSAVVDLSIFEAPFRILKLKKKRKQKQKWKFDGEKISWDFWQNLSVSACKICV